MVAFAVRFGRWGNVPRYVDSRFGIVDGQELLCDSRTYGFGKAAAQFAGNPDEHGLVPDLVVKSNFGVRDGRFQHDVENLGAFRGLASEEGPADGSVEKQVLDEECRPVARGVILLAFDVSTLDDEPSALAAVGAGGNGHFRNGGDGRHCLSTESVRMEVEQVVSLVQLGCRVPQVA